MNKPFNFSLDESRFARLESAERVWAVAAIHGHAQKLATLHKDLEARFRPGDRLVYLGNYIGVGPDVRATIDELLRARRRLLARAGTYEPRDFVYLRGSQEEMLSKLLQLQFAQNHGLGPTIEAYGSTLTSARGHMRDGPIGITKWTSALRSNMHKLPGHHELMTAVKRAAYTECGGLFFVHASVDPNRPLNQQGDSFWWDTGVFDQVNAPFNGFLRVVRGFDQKRRGINLDHPHAVTIDGGCGRDGTLVAMCFCPDGQVLDRLEA
jgi:serine/threonine protein phosphatase 1